ncbi:DJ-1/PfpI family protein [Chromobacterium sp. ASV23]|uniref:DJ-1/PfpI family protein n=1 Tax=Chromobacterium sp. ASV23 TaxID=2795110 RepID=UPI0018EBDE08|nr:DJ-1/PfpI family protein [Chromobacterium sp. ASV23]
MRGCLGRLMVAMILLLSCATGWAAGAPPLASTASVAETIAPYAPRFGRTRPVVAVVGVNEGTVLPDYAVPYGILARSGLADVVALAVSAGPMKLPPLTIRPDSTLAQFDGRYPQGADYVFVPAVDMAQQRNPALLGWLAAQEGKGATLIGICNGSIVLANAGLLHGRRATGHFSTEKARREHFPDTAWVKNTRYQVDGRIVTSAGISAALPVSLALVEAIGGRDAAARQAEELGVAEWSARHNSDVFHIGAGDYASGIADMLFHRTRQVGIPVATGVDEVALALVAEAYSVTLRSQAYALGQSASAVRTRGGLWLLPDRVAGQGQEPDLVLPLPEGVSPVQALEQSLNDIVARFGKDSARFVALDMEYPWQGL